MTAKRTADQLERRIAALPPHSRKRIALQALCRAARTRSLLAEQKRARRRGAA